MDPRKYIYVMKGLSKAYPGGRQVLKDIWLSFFPGAKIGVLGLNGAGKSSLLKIMAGLDDSISGEAWAADGVKVGYLAQEPELDESRSVGDNVMDGVGPLAALVERFNEVSMRFGEELTDDEMNGLIEEQAELQERIDAADAWNLERRIDIAMDALRCPPAETAVANLSGGERRRVALARLLLSGPDMLLLDEPTNHLDAESVAWLERFLAEFPGTVVAVTHDRYFLDNVAGWILELDRGQGIPWQGNYSSWLDQKQKRLVQEGRAEAARQRTLGRELEWIRQAPRARQSKSKARVSAYESLLAEAGQQAPEQMQIWIPPGPRLGDVVVEARGVRKAFGERLLVDDLNFLMPPGSIVGIVGPNGAGKTTLFRMIAGQEAPDDGALRVGETVQFGFVDQSRASLDAGKTVWQEISGGLDMLATRQARDSQPRLCLQFQLQGRRPAEEGRHALRRRAQPGASRQGAEIRRQPAAARRADQRPRRRHHAGPGGGAARLRRIGHGDQPRPLVPRPHLHPHPRLRGRQQGGLERRQLAGLRGRPPQAPGRSGRTTPPHQIPPVGGVGRGSRSEEMSVISTDRRE